MFLSLLSLTLCHFGSLLCYYPNWPKPSTVPSWVLGPGSKPSLQVGMIGIRPLSNFVSCMHDGFWTTALQQCYGLWSFICVPNHLNMEYEKQQFGVAKRFVLHFHYRKMECIHPESHPYYHLLELKSCATHIAIIHLSFRKTGSLHTDHFLLSSLPSDWLHL